MQKKNKKTHPSQSSKSGTNDEQQHDDLEESQYIGKVNPEFGGDSVNDQSKGDNSETNSSLVPLVDFSVRGVE